MAVVATPIFAQASRHSAVAISTANLNSDGSGTIGVVFTADVADGSLIDHIDIKATGATTAGVVRLYIHNGTSFFLWREILVAAITPSVSIESFSARVDCSRPENRLFLAAGWSLRASTHIGEVFHVHAVGADF